MSAKPLWRGNENPEETCQRCGRPNICWHVENQRWNAAVPDDGILCPQCFVTCYIEATGDDPAWELRRDPNTAAADPVELWPAGDRTNWVDRLAEMNMTPVYTPRLEALEEIRQRVADGWRADRGYDFEKRPALWMRHGRYDEPISPEVAAVLWPTTDETEHTDG